MNTIRLKVDLDEGRAMFVDMPDSEIQRRIEFLRRFQSDAEVARLRAILDGRPEDEPQIQM